VTVVGGGGGRQGGEAVEWVGALWRMVMEEQEGIEGCLAPNRASVFAEAHLGRCM